MKLWVYGMDGCVAELLKEWISEQVGLGVVVLMGK